MAFPIGQNNGAFTVEARVRFPGSIDTVMSPTELSGAIVTLSNASTVPLQVSLWYEKSTATATTGNIYVTSSAGRLQITSAPIFDDNFYNLAMVKERTTGSFSIYIARYDEGELVYSTSSLTMTSSVGYPFDGMYTTFDVGSSAVQSSKGQFWAQEIRVWNAAISWEEFLAHSDHFESYGRDHSHDNGDLEIHWRLADASTADSFGDIYTVDSTSNACVGTGSNYASGLTPFTKFLEDYAYIPSLDYGWNQKKIRVFSGSSIDPFDSYQDERFVSLEFNMVDALNEDISHLMTSYDEMIDFVGYPVNRYREDYEGIRQMRETYFKRLQGELNFRVFADMLDFFDRSFVNVVQRMLPARSLFKGDEFIVESHMLERPKYQYQLRPVTDGMIDISGSIPITDLWGDIGR